MVKTKNTVTTEGTGHRVGYIRVSTVNQNTDRQLDDVMLDKVFEDKCSGGSTKRPQLQALLEYVREGDTIFVHSLDRLARNLDDLRRLVSDITRRGIKIHFIKENLIFTGDDSPMSKMILSIMGSLAEFERSMIRERQREGIDAAMKAGKYKGGRKKVLSEEQQAELKRRVEAGEKKAALARELGISRESLYCYLGKNKTPAKKTA